MSCNNLHKQCMSVLARWYVTSEQVKWLTNLVDIIGFQLQRRERTTKSLTPINKTAGVLVMKQSINRSLKLHL